MQTIQIRFRPDLRIDTAGNNTANTDFDGSGSRSGSGSESESGSGNVGSGTGSGQDSRNNINCDAVSGVVTDGLIEPGSSSKTSHFKSRRSRTRKAMRVSWCLRRYLQSDESSSPPFSKGHAKSLPPPCAQNGLPVLFSRFVPAAQWSETVTLSPFAWYSVSKSISECMLCPHSFNERELRILRATIDSSPHIFNCIFDNLDRELSFIYFAHTSNIGGGMTPQNRRQLKLSPSATGLAKTNHQAHLRPDVISVCGATMQDVRRMSLFDRHHIRIVMRDATELVFNVLSRNRSAVSRHTMLKTQLQRLARAPFRYARRLRSVEERPPLPVCATAVRTASHLELYAVQKELAGIQSLEWQIATPDESTGKDLRSTAIARFFPTRRLILKNVQLSIRIAGAALCKILYSNDGQSLEICMTAWAEFDKCANNLCTWAITRDHITAEDIRAHFA